MDSPPRPFELIKSSNSRSYGILAPNLRGLGPRCALGLLYRCRRGQGGEGSCAEKNGRDHEGRKTKAVDSVKKCHIHEKSFGKRWSQHQVCG